jgi:ATP-dependent protease ClpP protease subunit
MKRRIEDKMVTGLKLLAIGATFALIALASNIALGSTLQLKEASTTVIEGEINGRLFDMSVDLVLSSPGGSIVAGMIFIEAMQRAQERGTKFVCVVDKMAASMAFVILAACDNRYIMETSLLLWHPGRVGMNGYATSKGMKVIAKQLDIYNEYIDQLIRPALNVSDKIYHYYGDNDMVLTGVHMMKISPKFAVLVDDFVIVVTKKGKKK